MTTDLLDLESLTMAHYRAVKAVQAAMPSATDDQADELVEAITALVFETLKQYLPGEDSCN